MKKNILRLQYKLPDKRRQKSFNKLQSFKKQAMLAGGTALLLQIGHRASKKFLKEQVKEFRKQMI